MLLINPTAAYYFDPDVSGNALDGQVFTKFTEFATISTVVALLHLLPKSRESVHLPGSLNSGRRKIMLDAPSLLVPSERPQLEPFATVFSQVIVPEAVAGGWFRDRRDVPLADLERITRRIESLNEQLLGHALHPAIYVHALLVCGHFFYQTTATAEVAEDLTTDFDSAFSLVQSLVLHHDLYDLYLLIG
jgi:hypothetical protein